MLVKLATILGKLTLCYEHREYHQLTGWYEYQVADDVRRFATIYDQVDQVRAKLFWQNDRDGEEFED